MENIYHQGWSDIIHSAQPRAENLIARKLFYNEATEVDVVNGS